LDNFLLLTQPRLLKKLFFTAVIIFLSSWTHPADAQHAVGVHFALGKSYSLSALKPDGEKAYYSVAPGFDYQFTFSEKFSCYGSIGLLSSGRHQIDTLRWGSETDSMGNYIPDPSLPHKSDKRIFQLFGAIQAGIKYYITDNDIRFFLQPYLEGDIFLSNRNTTLYFLDNNDLDTRTSAAEPFTPKRKFVLSAGLGFGAEKDLGYRFTIYLVADGKLMTTDVASLDRSTSVIPSIKAGVFYKI
jgi:hypothetical protein